MHRAIVTLKFLGYLDRYGQPTSYLDLYRPQSSWQRDLAAALRTAYADLFALLDPRTATPGEIRDGCKLYEPRGMVAEIASLFIGLCEQAALRPLLDGSLVAATPRSAVTSPRVGGRQPAAVVLLALYRLPNSQPLLRWINHPQPHRRQASPARTNHRQISQPVAHQRRR